MRCGPPPLLRGHHTKPLMLKSNKGEESLLCVSRLFVLPGRREPDVRSCWRNRHGVGGLFPSALSVRLAGSEMAGLLLLFTVGALFASSNAQENNYNKLSGSFKKGVDLALEKLHSHAGIRHHFAFFKSLLLSDIQVTGLPESVFLLQCCGSLLWLSPGKATSLKTVLIGHPFLSFSLVLKWPTSTTTSTLKPPVVRKEQLSPRGVSSETTGWDLSAVERQCWPQKCAACSNQCHLCLCAFMQPLIDCAVCYKTLREEIEPEPRPYLHCIHKAMLTEVSLLT